MNSNHVGLAILAVLLFSQPGRAEAQVPAVAVTSSPVATSPEEPPLIDTAPLWAVPVEVLLARRCINEATWNPVDCEMISRLEHGFARANNMTLQQWLIHHYGQRSLRPNRHIPTDANADGQPDVDRRGRLVYRHPLDRPEGMPWISDLHADGHEPAAWSHANTMPWEGTRGGRVRWEAQLAIATQAVRNLDRLPYPCQGRVTAWGGPELDAAAIQRLLARGMRVVTCPGASNSYLGPGTPVAQIEPQGG